MQLKKLMVFTDFTEASSLAVSHCFEVAKRCNAEVISFHVISEDEDAEWAEKKCIEQIQNIDNFDSNVPFKALASKQDLFKGMNKWLEKQAVELTFMATHGKKDIQFLTGSHALKLIFNAEIPTLVVQHKTPLRPYYKILLPVFSHQADMQFPVATLNSIAKIFNASLTLLTPLPKDENEKLEIQQTVSWLKGLFGNSFSTINIKESNFSEKKLDKAVHLATQEDNTDLIAVVIGSKHHRAKSEKNKKFIQSLITNEGNLPVLCL